MPTLACAANGNALSFSDEEWIELLEECLRLGWNPEYENWKELYSGKNKIIISQKDVSQIADILIKMSSAKLENGDIFTNFDDLLIHEVASILVMCKGVEII